LSLLPSKTVISAWMFTTNLAYVSQAPSRQGMGYVWLNTDYSESSCSNSD